jgi:hypothetical protein
MKCMNCGCDFETPYCGQCGQEAASGAVTLAEMKRSALRAFSLERGWLHTVVDLCTRPGAMLRDYLGGKRVVYIGPVKFALTIGAIYLIAMGVFHVPTPAGVSADEERAVELWNEFSQRFGQPLLLLAAPLIALATRLLFRGRGYTFAEHLTINLYIIGMQTLLVTPLFAFASFGMAVFAIAYTLCLLLMIAYFIWVIRQTLASSWWTAILGGVAAVIATGIFYMGIVTPIFLLFARMKGAPIV